MVTIRTDLPGTAIYALCTRRFLEENGIDDFEIGETEYGVTTFLEFDVSDEDAIMLRLLYSSDDLETEIGNIIHEYISLRNLYENL